MGVCDRNHSCRPIDLGFACVVAKEEYPGGEPCFDGKIEASVNLM
jgi:hypothetical protein